MHMLILAKRTENKYAEKWIENNTLFGSKICQRQCKQET